MRVRTKHSLLTPKRLSLAQALLQEAGLEKQSPSGQRQAPPLVAGIPHGELPLSFAQQRLWFLYQLDPDSPLYNIAASIRLQGRINVNALEQSLNEIVRRHAALRTTFRDVEGRPMQFVAPEMTLSLPIVDLGHLPDIEQQLQVQQWATTEARQPFDLTQGPLLRARLLRLSAQDHILILVVHHIVSDGWSAAVFTQEFGALYAAFAAGQSSPLPALPIQYTDYAVWQRAWLQGEVLEQELAYWKEQLANTPPVLDLPSDRPRPAEPTYCGAQYSFQLNSSLVQGLHTLSRQAGVTLFMTLLAAFDTLLYRYTGQTDIIVGSPIANRTRIEVADLIGFFVNTLALRVQVTGNLSFRDVLGRVREVALGAYAHQDLPFEMLVGVLQVERSLSHTPLFQVMFALQNTPRAILALDDLTISPAEIDTGTAIFDLVLHIEEHDQGVSGKFEYRTELFDASTIARLASHYQTLLESISVDPDQSIADLALLSEAERNQLLVEWNATETDYPRNRALHELFEAQVARTPEAVALVFDEEWLTYRELNARANELAHELQMRGVGPETPVGVYLKRSVEMIVGLLGVLKAGGAYVPLDPHYPQERLALILADTQAPIVLTQLELKNQLPLQNAHPVVLRPGARTRGAGEQLNPGRKLNPSNLAYFIYTSGSTGRPKGVAIEHRSAIAYVQWATNAFGTEGLAGVLASTSICFDMSVLELFVPLSCGGMIILAENALHLPDLPARDAVRWVDTVPSAIRELLSEEGLPDSVRVVSLGGERLTTSIVEHLYQHAEIEAVYDIYGPSETTTNSTYALRSAKGPETIGRPIANTWIYLLDKTGQPVPIGVVGEVYIGGAGVARGYLGRPELTAERFVPDPFASSYLSPLKRGEAAEGRRMYRTGDLARYRPDGTLEFLGRMDHQIKIRGFRVELDEIESVLGQHPGVRETVVMVRESEQGARSKRLVAYVIPAEAFLATATTLRSYLKDKLPDYMVPAAFVFLNSFPLSPNGKVNRRALPSPEFEEVETRSFTAARTPVEKTLTDIWSQVLGVKRVGVHDNFFELGGDSILGIQIIARANRAGLRFTPRQVFQYQTIAELAKALDTSPASKAEQGLVVGEVPLTPIQRWFFEKNPSGPPHWNQAVLLQSLPTINALWLYQAVAYLLSHHDALRLRFIQHSSGWQQLAAPLASEAAPFSYVDLAGLSRPEQILAIESAAVSVQASLNLTQGPLWRVTHFDLGAQEPSRLLIVIHHLAVDGVSWRILLEDLQTAYLQLSQGQPIALPAKTTSFKQWAERLVEYAQSPVVRQAINYWLAEPWSRVTPLPIDHVTGHDQNIEASACTLSEWLSAEETRALLQEVPSVYRTQINDVLLTALAQAFASWTGSPFLLIDLEGHGREEIAEATDLSRTVGWFTTIFPVVLKLETATQAGEALQAVKRQLRHIPQHGLGYGLLRYLNGDVRLAEKLSALPQAEVSFNYLGQFDQLISDSALYRPALESSGPAHAGAASRRYLIEVNASVMTGRLQIDWTYNPRLHDQETMMRLARGFREALQTLSDHCRKIKSQGYTPDDFPLTSLDPAALDRLLQAFPQLEDIYPLSPGQQEMLKYILDQPQAGLYSVQWHFIFGGTLDSAAFQQAWQQVIDRHSILRTAFVVEDLQDPVQIVQRDVKLTWEQRDWRALSPEAQQKQLELLLQQDQRQGFDVRQAPLMRFVLIQTAAATFHFVWTHSHLLLDGWSMTPLLTEVLTFYEAFRQGQGFNLSQARPYREFIAWLQQQDVTGAEAFWSTALQNFKGPVPWGRPDRSPAPSGPAEYAEQQVRLSAQLTAQLQAFAHRSGLTLNTCVQGAWALLLSSFSGQDDVALGVTLAGRPALLTEVEAMVGMFVNTLPLRVQVSLEQPVLSWLKSLQDQQVEMMQYGYSPLSSVQAWSSRSADQPLFESSLRFQNYPAKTFLSIADHSLQVEDYRVIDRWSYPLDIIVDPGPELTLFMTYPQRRFESRLIEQMLSGFQTLLAGLVEDPEQPLGGLRRLIDKW